MTRLGISTMLDGSELSSMLDMSHTAMLFEVYFGNVNL